MAVISFFKTSGAGQVDLKAATNYLYGPLCSLTDEQKKEYSDAYQLRKLARETNDIQTEWETNYILQQQKGERRDPPPESINGNRKAVEYAIEHNPHKHKYVSGVIAHALEDTEKIQANPEIEVEWRELFEDLCFAGFPKEERLVDWVRHTHQGNIENHFLIPRIHLASGLSFNPAPPGHENDFNLLRDYLNLKHDLASPLDAMHRRLTQDSKGFDKRHKLKKEINRWVSDMIANARVGNRADIIRVLNGDKFKQASGVTHVSESKNFLRLHFKDRKNLRLKGFAFTDQFTSKESLTQSAEPLQNKALRLTELKSMLDIVIAKRVNYNQSRYKLNDSQSDLNVTVAHYLPQNSHWMKVPVIYASQSSPSLPVMPDFNENLTGYDMLIQLERRKAAAAQIALEAQTSQNQKQLKIIQELTDTLLKERKYESHREAISVRVDHLNQRAADFERTISDIGKNAKRVLPTNDQANSRRVPAGTQDDIERHYSNQSDHSERISSLCRELEGAIGSIKRNLRIHSTANQELGTSLEHAGKLAERQRDSYLELGRAFELIASDSKLKAQLKSRLSRNEAMPKNSNKHNQIERALSRLKYSKNQNIHTFEK
ncbi:relaxase/mobilization nuclease domain-containing protein [Vibrio cyclitrophicus]